MQLTCLSVSTSLSLCEDLLAEFLLLGIGHSDYAQHRLKEFCTHLARAQHIMIADRCVIADIGEVEGEKRHDNIGEGLPWYYQTRVRCSAWMR